MTKKAMQIIKMRVKISKETTDKAAARKLRQVARCLEEVAGLVEPGGDMEGGLRTLRTAREGLAKIEQMISL